LHWCPRAAGTSTFVGRRLPICGISLSKQESRHASLSI